MCLFKLLVLTGFKLLLLTFKGFRLLLCLLFQLSKLGVLPVKSTSGSFQLSDNLFKAAGKFFAATVVFLVGMAIYIPYILVILKLAGTIAWASVIGNLLGLLLLGCSFISIGIFVSSLTELQIVAAIVSSSSPCLPPTAYWSFRD